MGALFRLVFWGLLFTVIGLGGFGFYLTTIGPDPVVKPERQMSSVWADYPFESHYIHVKGSKLHYIEYGNPEGPVFLFLHGNPTSSYLWRDILPIVAASGVRAIAVDNIGFGASDRPDIGYTFAEHADYLDGFIDEMGLTDITLVIHDWGSALGFDYAYRNPDNVRGIAFMEAIYRVPSLADLDDFSRTMFKGLRTPVLGELFVLGGNGFVERILPTAIMRDLSAAEMAAYREPFPTFGSRLPTLVWPRQVPFDGEPDDVALRVQEYSNWLPTSSAPKLLLYFDPGALIGKEDGEKIARDWTNTEAVFLGEGIHFVQEDHGPAIGDAIVAWSATTILAAPTGEVIPEDLPEAATDPAGISSEDLPDL